MQKKKKLFAKCGHKRYPCVDTMETTNNNSDYIKLRASQDFKTEVEEFASSREISVSALTRIALVEYMKKDQPKRKKQEAEA